MSSYYAPVGDTRFVLDEVDGLDRLANMPGFASAVGPTSCKPCWKKAASSLRGCMFPLNAVRRHCRLQARGRWPCDRAAGVHGSLRPVRRGRLDHAACARSNGAGRACRWSWRPQSASISSRPTTPSKCIRPDRRCGSSAILAVGSDALKQKYVPNMVAGRWCRHDEPDRAPHAGTDLGMIKTRAEPQADGSHKITGTKIFISGGEHEMSENIIHLVLAKTPGAPEGSKGISLFLVPA